MMLLSDKVEAIKNLAVISTKRQLRSCIRLINYHREMWQYKSKILTPLSSTTSKQAKWNWSKECRKVFNAIKKLIFRETLLSYPNFNESFEIHMDASKLHLGSVISQKCKPGAFYSKKLNPVQVIFTTTEHELLSIL